MSFQTSHFTIGSSLTMVIINAILIPQVECPMCRVPITYDLAEFKTVASGAENEEEVCPKLPAVYNDNL